MHIAFAHALGLFVAAAVARYGWFMAHNPERASRLYLFGQEPVFGKRLAVIWSRVVGWMFIVGGSFGAVLYLVMIPIDLFHSH